jgi:hypothetical protein
MKQYFASIFTYLTCLTLVQAAVEPGFMPLLDKENTSGWSEERKPGIAQICTKLLDGVLTMVPQKDWSGVYWYNQRAFSDFTLRLRYKLDDNRANSGVSVRMPEPEATRASVNKQPHYEIDVSLSRNPLEVSGAIMFVQAPTTAPQQEIGKWNDIEITALGQSYTVSVNGQIVNEFTGKRSTSGFIGLQIGRKGVHFTDIRIRELSSPASPLLRTIQSDANQPRIEVIKDQGPNATEWALSPLDEVIPADIRQNLTFLREDLLDEGKKAAKSSSEAYKLASDYCDKLLAALSQREIARVQAGYSAAQADANNATSNQALDARRNHQMSWPQFSREESQRATLRESETNKADVKKQRLKVEWTTRAEQMRLHLDTTYRQLREAMR